MDRADVIRELREMSQYYEAEAETFDAAIAFIEPQPVSEDSLREAGFRRLKPGLPAWTLPIGSGRIVGNVAGEFRLDTGEDCIPLHITDMQHLNAVIASLRGTDAR